MLLVILGHCALSTTMRFIDNKTIAFCITIVILIGVAHLLQLAISFIINRLNRKLHN